MNSTCSNTQRFYASAGANSASTVNKSINSPSHGELNVNLHTSNSEKLHENCCKHLLDQSTHVSRSFPCVTSVKCQKYVSSPRSHFCGFPLKSPQLHPVSVIGVLPRLAALLGDCWEDDTAGETT